MNNLGVWLYHYASKATIWLRDLLQQVRIMAMPLPVPVAYQRVRQPARQGVRVTHDSRPKARDIVPWI